MNVIVGTTGLADAPGNRGLLLPLDTSASNRPRRKQARQVIADAYDADMSPKVTVDFHLRHCLVQADEPDFGSRQQARERVLRNMLHPETVTLEGLEE